MQKKPRMG